MALVLSPPKLVLLAVHFAVKADIDSLTALAARHGTLLRKDLLLRIALTYLPETLPSQAYVGFIEQLETGAFPDTIAQDIDCSTVDALTDPQAAKKLRKLRLLPLAFQDAPEEAADDYTTLFLLRRSYRVDEEAGLLDELPTLLMPFLDHSPYIRTLMVSIILPLLRRNCEYHPQDPIPYTLLGFEQLPDRVAVNLLLSQTGVREADLALVGRDLKGLIGPWLFNERRWKDRKEKLGDPSGPELLEEDETDVGLFPGWEQVLQWLTARALKTWKVAVSAVEQWDGPGDVDLGGWGVIWLRDEEQDHLERGYARAALASAYLIPEASAEALEGAYRIVAKIAGLLDQDPLPRMPTALAILPPLADQITSTIQSAKNATYMRNDLLAASNILTSPTKSSVAFLQAIILSAALLTKLGSPCTVRRAGELALLQDEREQKAEATKLIHALGNNGPKTDDKFWIKTRNEILWLRGWGADDVSSSPEPLSSGVFSQLKKEFLEVEILKALLSNTRYTLARSIYEDSPDKPLAQGLLQDTIFATAMIAYDNASNPNRTRGGLKKCDDIIKAFPETVDKSTVTAQRLEALLQATHALSKYRLVLKQGEPFTPIVLRVHTDPVSIVGKILEQNPKSYTRIQDLVNLGHRIVQAGLTAHEKAGHSTGTPETEAADRLTAESRITAMCIDAALTEDDFETAYSYVVNRLDSAATNTAARQPVSKAPQLAIADDFSWKAALQAGKYRRTARTLRPTHLGTTSANPEIRHLEQRIECLATALRIAPAPTLQEILNAFRRAEEELDAAVKAEAEQEDAWDTAGDSINTPGLPGGFSSSPYSSKPGHAATTTKHAPSSRRSQVEEAPMSLFDLSRASVMSAQKNLSALSSLQRSAGPGARGVSVSELNASAGSDGEDGPQQGEQKRARKRDQLREAAMGTLVSGVGWLINAPSNERE
ncbi:Sec39 domain-containing protein [Lasiosphaeria ovina]|uniref:Sec39 domain-containing protein n=1 Tax=Lasiosphaeria ovina TaxID=92902 RepID=A0AAE0KBK4_9PEZI|nr:Sec39 domain-containing protein [Lasiosphaeria ovina]